MKLVAIDNDPLRMPRPKCRVQPPLCRGRSMNFKREGSGGIFFKGGGGGGGGKRLQMKLSMASGVEMGMYMYPLNNGSSVL